MRQKYEWRLSRVILQEKVNKDEMKALFVRLFVDRQTIRTLVTSFRHERSTLHALFYYVYDSLLQKVRNFIV